MGHPGAAGWVTEALCAGSVRAAAGASRMLADVQSRRIALAQIAPRLGSLEVNLATHHDLLAKAREGGADLVVFPELGLTGYQLQDLASEVAMRLDDPRLATLAGATRGLSAVVSFVEESADHRLFIAAALLEDGEIRHVHRKLYLPTYGLFDERRFFAAGDVLRSVPSRLGVGLGIGVCEDFWHLSVPQLLALDGAQILINVSSSPGRDLAATNEVGLGTATSWRTLMRTYAQLTTSFVVFCNRVGVDESISFWGGSEVIAPSGQAIFSAPLYDEGLYMVDIPTADIRRERIALPLLRDERLELQVRELTRIVAERSGQAVDSNAEHGAEPGFDLVPADEPSLPIGFGVHDKPVPRPRPPAPARRRRPARRSRPRWPHRLLAARNAAHDGDRTEHRARAALRPAERAGDRHGYRAAGHRRVHPRAARAGRLRARRPRVVGRDRLGGRRISRRRGDRARSGCWR